VLEGDVIAGIPRDPRESRGNGFESEFNPEGRSGMVPVLTGTVGSDLAPSTAGMVGKDGQRHTGHPVFCSSHTVSLRKQLDSVFLSRGDVAFSL